MNEAQAYLAGVVACIVTSRLGATAAEMEAKAREMMELRPELGKERKFFESLLAATVEEFDAGP